MLLIPVCPFSLIQSRPLFQLSTLRGSITEDSIPSSSKHGTSRRLPLKDVLEFVVPQLSIHSLRLAADSPRVPELLLQLDQQEVSQSQCATHQLTMKYLPLPWLAFPCF